MDYYALALYSTNEEPPAMSNGYISFEDLGVEAPDLSGSDWLIVEAKGASPKPIMEEPQEMVGGYLKQSTNQRASFEIPLRALTHPDESAKRTAIYDIFTRENIFLAPLDYDAPDLIAPSGFAIQVSGIVETEDVYEDGVKELVLKLSAVV